MTALEADFATYKRDHSAADEAEHARLMTLAGDIRGTVNGLASDLGTKADLLRSQGQRIEQEADKIRFQGNFLARVGLLVVFGAAVGGGGMQVALWYLTVGHAPSVTTHPR